MQDVESVATSVFPFWILCTKRWLLCGFRLSAQAEPLQCVPDRLVMGRGDIAEGLHELAAIHHKGLVEFIQHLSDFAHQQIRDRTHPGGSWASSKKRVSIWRVVSVGALGICQLWPSASSCAPSSCAGYL